MAGQQLTLGLPAARPHAHIHNQQERVEVPLRHSLAAQNVKAVGHHNGVRLQQSRRHTCLELSPTGTCKRWSTATAAGTGGGRRGV